MCRPSLLLALLPFAVCARAQGPDLAALKLASAATVEEGRMTPDGALPEGTKDKLTVRAPETVQAEKALKLGIAALDGPSPAASLDWFKQAVALDPHVKNGHYLLGCAFQLNAQWDMAIAEFRQHLAILRNSPDADLTWSRAEKHIVECAYGKDLMAHPGRSYVTSAGQVNTAADEYAPLPISGGALLFTRTSTVGGPDSMWTRDAVFMSRWTAEGWAKADRILADRDDATTACINAVGMRPMTWQEDGTGRRLMELASSDLERARPVAVPMDFANDPTAGTPYFTADGQWFYFSSARQGGLGGSDLYRCQWNASRKEWSSAVNLGAPVNTEYDEEGAFLTLDGGTLYFASTGHSSMGGYDLFKATAVNGLWSVPGNLGSPVNSPGDDRGLTLTPDARSGYFSSDRAGGRGRSDIYRVDFSEGGLADATAMLANAGPGVPTTEDEQRIRLIGFIKGLHMMKPVQARIVVMDLADTSFTLTFTSDPVTGEFTADVPAGRNYAMHVSANGFLPHSDLIQGGATSGDLRMDMGLKTTEAGNSEVMRNIFFDGNSCTLEPSTSTDLLQLLEFMRSNPDLRIEIDGHTDSDNGPMPNQELSEERAKAVMDWLVDHGVSPSRLVAKGFGATRPVVPNDSRPNKALNRRTEIKVL